MLWRGGRGGGAGAAPGNTSAAGPGGEMLRRRSVVELVTENWLAVSERSEGEVKLCGKFESQFYFKLDAAATLRFLVRLGCAMRRGAWPDWRDGAS